MTYVIEIPDSGGLPGWLIFIIGLVVVCGIFYLFIGLALRYPKKLNLDGALIVSILLSTLCVLSLFSVNAYNAHTSFNEAVKSEFKRSHGIHIAKSVEIRRGVTNSAVFATEDGKFREGDIYYNKVDDTLTLVESK